MGEIMLVAYWIIAALLAAFYLYSGGVKIVRTPDQLRPMMHWIDTVPLPAVRTIGVLEVAGALGLILPPLTGVLPILAVVAAVGLALVQVAATILHLAREEARQIGMNIALLALAVAAAWLAILALPAWA
jgi:hypothetical protein